MTEPTSARRQPLSNPVTLLAKYQRTTHENPLTESELCDVWEFLNAYVSRLEASHFGSKDLAHRYPERHEARVLMVARMLREMRTINHIRVPFKFYITGKTGKVRETTRYARACSWPAEHRHPNLVLTNARRAVSNIEMVIRAAEWGVDLNGTQGGVDTAYVVNHHTLLESYTDASRRQRDYRLTDVSSITNSWLADHPDATERAIEVYRGKVADLLAWQSRGYAQSTTSSEDTSDRLGFKSHRSAFSGSTYTPCPYPSLSSALTRLLRLRHSR